MDLKKQGEKQFKQSFRTFLFLLQLRSKLKAKKEKNSSFRITRCARDPDLGVGSNKSLKQSFRTFLFLLQLRSKLKAKKEKNSSFRITRCARDPDLGVGSNKSLKQSFRTFLFLLQLRSKLRFCRNKKDEHHVFVFCWSGWQDSNLRPPAPKAGAMTGLRYTPSGVYFNNSKTKFKAILLLVVREPGGVYLEFYRETTLQKSEVQK